MIISEQGVGRKSGVLLCGRDFIISLMGLFSQSSVFSLGHLYWAAPELGARVEYILVPSAFQQLLWVQMMKAGRRKPPRPCTVSLSMFLGWKHTCPDFLCPTRSVSACSLEAAVSAELVPCTRCLLSQKRRSQRQQCPGSSAENSWKRPTLFLHLWQVERGAPFLFNRSYRFFFLKHILFLPA